MLPPLTRIARALQKKRASLRLSQRQVARLLGCSQSYLAQVETGRRPISRQMAERLESAFKVKAGTYTRAKFRRGRPTLEPQTRHALRAIRRAQGESPRLAPQLGRPRHPRADRVSGLHNPLWPMAIHLGEEAALEVKRLEEQRGADESFWRHLNGVRFDSWSEKRLQVKLGLTGAQLTGVSPASVGCVLPNLDGQTGRDSSRRAYPAYVLHQPDLSVAIFPQRCVGTCQTHRWPDNLVIASHNGRKLTAVIEVDGEEYHRDALAERRRESELNVPILRLDAAELGQAALVDKMLLWLKEQLARQAA